MEKMRGNEKQKKVTWLYNYDVISVFHVGGGSSRDWQNGNNIESWTLFPGLDSGLPKEEISHNSLFRELLAFLLIFFLAIDFHSRLDHEVEQHCHSTHRNNSTLS